MASGTVGYSTAENVIVATRIAQEEDQKTCAMRDVGAQGTHSVAAA